MAVPGSSLAATARGCAHAFAQLLALLQDSHREELSQLTQSTIDDECGRFKIWAGNLGALQQLPSTTSLDHRLRESPKVAFQILELLEDLRDALQTIYAIASGARANRQVTSTEGEDDDDEFDEEDNDHRSTEFSEEKPNLSEAQELFESAKETLNNLFRISIIIRNASPRDRFAKALTARLNPFNDQFDISHVGHKYSLLETPEKQWLKERLGKAITQRRQFLRYARDHRDKVGREPSELWKPQNRDDESNSRGQPLIVDYDAAEKNSKAGFTNYTGPTSTLAPTNASTLLLSALENKGDDFEDNRSQTSYAMSIGDEDEDSKARLPRLEDVSRGMSPFECPFCWTIQDLRKESSWKKHAFSDLRPYICTFEKCDVKLFSDRRDWFEHELRAHRVQWRCHFCIRESFHSQDKLKKHLELCHAQNLTEDHLQALCEASKHPVDRISALDCPFCQEWEAQLRDKNPNIPAEDIVVVTPAQFRHHVGSHMQQLALFAIPRGHLEEDSVNNHSVASVAVAGAADEKSSKPGSAVGAFKFATNSSHSKHSFPSEYASSGQSGSSVMGEGERQIVFSAPDDLDPEEDAIVLAKSLSQITPDTKILVDILPRLSHAQMMQIRTEYKRFVRVKINDEGDTRGVNLAKHIKLRCTDEFGKICYVTALGCWESDAYWANTPFQPTSCRNELLIEALIARSNYEIENIIAAFRNKQYSNSLAKCLDHELENGSQILRRAVVLALEGKRQEASDERPVGDDVDICRGALHDGTVKSTTLLDMLMTRSESHIRKLLKEYETRFNEHFAKAAVKKWPDMLGEILAHIFNAAINRPARDAILIHHSLEEFSHEPTAKEPRYELLISRLVRLHWESPRYMHYVKNEYQHKFGHSIMEAIKNMTKDDFCSFCLALLRPRPPQPNSENIVTDGSGTANAAQSLSHRQEELENSAQDSTTDEEGVYKYFEDRYAIADTSPAEFFAPPELMGSHSPEMALQKLEEVLIFLQSRESELSTFITAEEYSTLREMKQQLQAETGIHTRQPSTNIRALIWLKDAEAALGSVKYFIQQYYRAPWQHTIGALRIATIDNLLKKLSLASLKVGDDSTFEPDNEISNRDQTVAPALGLIEPTPPGSPMAFDHGEESAVTENPPFPESSATPSNTDRMEEYLNGLVEFSQKNTLPGMKSVDWEAQKGMLAEYKKTMDLLTGTSKSTGDKQSDHDAIAESVREEIKLLKLNNAPEEAIQAAEIRLETWLKDPDALKDNCSAEADQARLENMQKAAEIMMNNMGDAKFRENIPKSNLEFEKLKQQILAAEQEKDYTSFLKTLDILETFCKLPGHEIFALSFPEAWFQEMRVQYQFLEAARPVSEQFAEVLARGDCDGARRIVQDFEAGLTSEFRESKQAKMTISKLMELIEEVPAEFANFGREKG